MTDGTDTNIKTDTGTGSDPCPGGMSLNPRQEAFCRHMAEGHSAAQAARLAGYAPGSARQTGHELLRHPDISRRICDLRNEIASRREAEIAVLITRLQRIEDSARRCGGYGAAVRAVEMEARLRGLLGDRLPLPALEQPEPGADMADTANAKAPEAAPAPAPPPTPRPIVALNTLARALHAR